MEDGVQVFRLPVWGFDYCEARYYGRRHSVHVGPLLILWGQMTEAELRAMGDEPLPCPFCGGPAKLSWMNGARQATCAMPYAGCCGSDVFAPVPMWNRRVDATALAEAQAEIARLHDQIGDWIVRADEASARADGMEAEMQRQSVRYVPAQGATIQEMRDSVRQTDLYTFGDCRLVWVNEGDLYSFPFRAALTDKPDAQGEG